MTLFRLRDDLPTLSAPVLIGAFDGWIDAGGAASGAAERLAEGTDTIATADADALFDYRSRRPVLDVVDGTLSSLDWPQISIARRPEGGRDLLVLHGPEPDFRWRELGEQVMETAVRLGVVQWVSMGAIPAAVPHTRPVHVFGTASSEGLLHDDVDQGPQGLLRVPGGGALGRSRWPSRARASPRSASTRRCPTTWADPSRRARSRCSSSSAVTSAWSSPSATFPRKPSPTAAARRRGRRRRGRPRVPRAARVDRGEEHVPSGDELASEIERFLQGEAGGRRAPSARLTRRSRPNPCIGSEPVHPLC